MATLTTQQITPGGVTPTYAAAAAGGDKVRPGPTTFLHFKNVSGGIITVTIDEVGSASPSGASAFNADLVVAVPATTGEKMVGPITDRFAGSDGLAAITYSGVTTFTVAAISI